MKIRIASFALTVVLAIARSALAGDPVPCGPFGAPPDYKSSGFEAGCQGGHLFWGEAASDFYLYPGGRFELDGVVFVPPGVDSSTVPDRVSVRRLQPELSGELLGHLEFTLGWAWASSAVVAPPGAGAIADAKAGQTKSLSGLRSVPADRFVNLRAASWFNLQIGEFDVPFTLENRTSDRYTPFLERALGVRTLGAPTNKAPGMMFWGEPWSRVIHYEVGRFGSEGRRFEDGYDLMGRVFFHPFFFFPIAKEASFGGSLRHGYRDPGRNDGDVPGFTTQGGFEFWATRYDGAGGLTHVLPSGASNAVAFEIRVPVTLLDITWEYLAARQDTREWQDGAPESATLREGNLGGSSWYLELGLWPFGKENIEGRRGYEPLVHVDRKLPDRPDWLTALEVLFKYEHLSAAYDSAARSGVPDLSGGVDGAVRVSTFSTGLNYWWTRHVRCSADFVYEWFPGAAGNGPTPAERAIAPAQLIPIGKDDGARGRVHDLRELHLRAAISI